MKQRYQSKRYPCSLRVEDGIRLELLANGNYVVYGLLDPRDGTIFYIGQTCQFHKRMIDHSRIYPFSPHRRPLDKRKYAIFEAGLDTIVTIFGLCPNKEQALEREYELIRHYKSTLLNIQTSRWIHYER